MVFRPPQASPRVLVVDDDPSILHLATAILKRHSFTVVTARDGREAYNILQEDAGFVAAIVDVMMPHISGPELASYMKKERRLSDIPVIMMTAEQDLKLPSKSFSAGAGVFLPKPFSVNQLLSVLHLQKK